MLLFLVLSSFDLYAQRSPFDSVWTREAAQIREEVDCFTDRSLYMVEEPIQFRARVSVSGPIGPRPWSTVLYAELISVDGKRVTWAKFPIRKHIAFGEIEVPPDLLTGLYYLRIYTRWMRNRGPEHFSYFPLRIINPKRSELYQASPRDTDSTPIPVQRSQEVSLKFSEQPSSFERGDSMTLDLMVYEGNLPDSVKGCLTIVPIGVEPSTTRYSAQTKNENFRVDFLPDRYGPSLSGSVQYPDGIHEELPPALIHLSLVGDATGYLVCRSDARGKFTVGLPMRSGKLEIFVQPEGPDKVPVEVRIDQDFDPHQIHFVTSTFTLTDQEIELATIMARKIQLSTIYGQADTIALQDSTDHASSFYGTPTFSVDLDQYILLPTLKEVFLNLVPGVTPVRRKGRTSLSIESENPSLSLYESLVMVDQVPVLDMEQFMSLSPAKIKQIDVVEDVYVKGELRFGGVINLHSRDRDMAGVDLPEHSFFIDYMAMQLVILPKLENASLDDRLPDMRNTLLWQPNFILKKESPSSISFIAPDYPGEFVVLFRGYSDQGELVQAETTFRVR